MIRGPVMPQVRESLWSLVAHRLDSLETGLSLVLEGLDCSAGQLGAIEGLARDANGAPVLLLLATDGDALLSARVFSAVEFLDRVGDSLSLAIPEGGFASGVRGRVVVVGTEAATASFEMLRRLPLPALQLCRLEPFRVAGSERFAVRWLKTSAPADVVAAEFAVPPGHQPHWQAIEQLCRRLDPGVSLVGDRFWRRITWFGHVLGQVLIAEGGLHVSGPDGVRRSVLAAADVREFSDQIVRRFAELRGLVASRGGAVVGGETQRLPSGGPAGRSAPRHAVESLRSTLVHARLSAEEYSALGDLARDAEAEVAADDVVRTVAAQEGPRAGASLRPD